MSTEASDATDPDEPAARLQVRSSTDLIVWNDGPTLSDDGVVPEGHQPLLQAVVAADAGLLVQFRITPASLPVLDEELEAQGYDADSLCEEMLTESTATFRVCGTTEEVRLSFDAAGRSEWLFDTGVLFATPGGDLEPIDSLVAEVGGPGESIYATESGFGFSGRNAFESDNGVDWVEADIPEDGVMIAEREGERVFRSWFPVQRFGADDPLVGMAHRAIGGEWQAVDLAELYENAGEQPRWFTGLRAGAGGWTLVAQRSPAQPPEVGVERDRRGDSDFVMTSDAGFVLSGHTPYGPATLVDPDGEQVRTWDQLEVTRPSWSGFVVDTEGVKLVDPDTGETIVTFTNQQWSVVIDPLGTLEYDVLHSSDGRNWEIVATYPTLPTVLAMADDELLVRRVNSLHYTQIAVETSTVPLD